MNRKMILLRRVCKPLLLVAVVCGAGLLSACSTNPATGKSQFTALMSPEQEVQVGASEHQKIAQQFGFYEDPALQSYVSGIGARVTKKTERPDVKYKFYVIDSPIVNAFALPGGYVYVSRGLLALANSEAELAAVLGHEVGHITGRHSAERYSRGTLASLGAAAVSIATGSKEVAQAAGVGANLYLSSYSRGQESEADSLGLRYMTQGGYDARNMAKFLMSMQSSAVLNDKIEGTSTASSFNYFSTHPATGDRIAQAHSESLQYAKNGAVGKETYFKAIDGIVFGDSPEQGYVRGQSFIHPRLGFAFDVPDGFTLKNQPSQVVATSSSTGAAIVFDMDRTNASTDPATYLSQLWLKGDGPGRVDRIMVNGMRGATTAFSGQVNGRPSDIRLMVIRMGENSFARFQIAIPANSSKSLVDGLKRSSYSLRKLDDTEKLKYKPYRVRVVTAKEGDSVASLASRFPFSSLKEERFRTLNGLTSGEQLVSGEMYKVISY